MTTTATDSATCETEYETLSVGDITQGNFRKDQALLNDVGINGTLTVCERREIRLFRSPVMVFNSNLFYITLMNRTVIKTEVNI